MSVRVDQAESLEQFVSAAASQPAGFDREASSHEELVHCLTHGTGALLSIGALVVLVVQAATNGTTTDVVAASVFGATLFLVYLSSTLYHAVPHRRRRLKELFCIFDHTCIHLLIAGTYTPFALCALGGTVGWTLFFAAWGLAITGIVVEVTSLRRFTKLSLALYVISGWIGVLAVVPLWQSLANGGMSLLVLGGLAYTLGVPFYAAHHKPWMHAIWHGFVLAGSALHGLAIAYYVMP